MCWRMDGSRYLECPSANSKEFASVRTVLLTSNSTRKSSESHTMSCIWDTGLSDDPSMLSLDLEPTLKPLLKLSMATYLPSSLHLTVNGKEDAVDTTTAHIDQVAVPCNMSRRHRSCCASPTELFSPAVRRPSTNAGANPRSSKSVVSERRRHSRCPLQLEC